MKTNNVRKPFKALMMGSLLAGMLAISLVSQSAAETDRSWEHYGGDAAGRRYSPHAQIQLDNVMNLGEVWRYRTGDASDGSRFPNRSSFKATPIYLDGRLIVVSGFNRVHALDPATGERLWHFDPEVDFSDGMSEMFTARGVTGWRDAGGGEDCPVRVFMGTLDARLIALDAATGKPCPSFGSGGQIDLSRGVQNFRRGEYALTSPPAVIGDVVVTGSSVGDNGAVELDHGIVRGFDARSGRLLWTWDPIPRSAEDPAYPGWTPKAARSTGAANVWSIISGDPDRDLVLLPTTSPSPDFFGGRRPGSNRNANSLVALDVTSGAMRWAFQTVHHDLWDYDLASQPSLGRDGRIWLPTKMGHVFVLAVDDGQPVYPVEERPVPASDVPGESAWPTQPIPRSPPALHPRTLAVEDAWGRTPEETEFCRQRIAPYRFDGLFTPPSLQGTLLYPGNYGGTNWGSAAMDEDRGVVVVPINRLATVVALVPRDEFRRRQREAEDQPIQFTEQSGTPFGMMRFSLVHPESRLPCQRGPWGTLVGLDSASGAVRWETPVGMEEKALGTEAAQWGSLLAGGPLATAGGLVFMATRSDRRLRALDTDSGRLIHEWTLPAGAHATPMSYQHGGRQYVVIAAGGSQAGTEMPGDFLMAFALEDVTDNRQ